MKVTFSSHPMAYIKRNPISDLCNTDLLTLSQELAYRRLVDLVAKHGPLPDDDKALAIETKVGRRWKAAKAKLLSTGHIVAEDGVIRVWPVYQVHELVVRADVTAWEWRSIREAVLTRDNHTCQYCGTTDGRIECDHVVPVAKGGLSVAENLCAACKPCNTSKGAKTLEEWKGRQCL